MLEDSTEMPSANLSTKSKHLILLLDFKSLNIHRFSKIGYSEKMRSLNLVGNYRSSGLTIARGTAACQNCFSQKFVICDNNKTALI